MARTKDTRAKVPKPTPATAKARRAATTGTKASKPRATAKASSARASKSRKASLEAVRTPVAEATEKTKKQAKKAKKAVKAAKAQALKLVPAFSASAVPAQVGDTFKAMGKQIAGALNTDVGRLMVAEMLIFVAKSLTKTAAGTEAAGDAKSKVLNAGAKIGAAAADAGSAAVKRGKKAVDAGVKAAGETGGTATDMLRDVASAAVGAIGGVVADVTEKAIARRRGRPPSVKPAASTLESGTSKPLSSKPAASKPAVRKAASSKAPAPMAETAPDSPNDGSTAASPISADAGHQPPSI